MKPRTPRSPKHLALLRKQPCAWCGRPPPSEASHHGRRGIGIKASDLDAIPLCRDDHAHHDGVRKAGAGPLPGAPVDFPVREWAAGYALGLRYRLALASLDPTEPSRWT